LLLVCEPNRRNTCRFPERGNITARQASIYLEVNTLETKSIRNQIYGKSKATCRDIGAVLRCN
jgi:hypothetical protein